MRQALVERPDGTSSVACERCVVASSAWLRLRGLLGRREIAAGDGLLLPRTGSIHMFFMRFALDAVFLDREDTVLHVAPGLRPWRIAARRGARSVLELRAGEVAARGIAPGDRIVLQDA